MTVVVGWCSLIQYMPNLARREGANVGIVLFVPDPHSIGVRISHDNECPRQRFGDDAIDDSFLNLAKASIKSRLIAEGKEWRSRDDLRHVTRLEANSMQMTPVFSALVDPLEFESELEALYRDLVYVPPR